jgi:hypothetical protein
MRSRPSRLLAALTLALAAAPGAAPATEIEVEISRGADLLDDCRVFGVLTDCAAAHSDAVFSGRADFRTSDWTARASAAATGGAGTDPAETLNARVRGAGDFLLTGPSGLAPFALTLRGRFTGALEADAGPAPGEGAGEARGFAEIRVIEGFRLFADGASAVARQPESAGDPGSAALDERLAATATGLSVGDVITLGFTLEAAAASLAPGSALADLDQTLSLTVDYAALPEGVRLQPLAGVAAAPPRSAVPLPAAGWLLAAGLAALAGAARVRTPPRPTR